ncbi:MAG: RNA polymerase sigma factor [Clostridia bacterium]|nr:RNA polymerase sigma factor [Clostridia bacterium]
MIDDGSERYLAFLAGNEAGFTEIVIAYRNGLIDFINRIVGDFHYSEEIAEDVFVLLYVKKPRFTPGAGFKTWLYAIAKNKALNFIKKRDRRSASALNADYASAESSDRVLNEIYLDERKVALHKALDELPHDYGLILHLHFLDGFSVNQIAELLKKKPRAVSDALYNAKKALRAIITQEEKYEILR